MKKSTIFLMVVILIVTISQSCTQNNQLKEAARLSFEQTVLDTLTNIKNYEFILISDVESFGKDNVVHRVKMEKDEIESAKRELDHIIKMQQYDIEKYGESGRSIRQSSIDDYTERISKAEDQMNYYNSMLDVDRKIYLYASAITYYLRGLNGIVAKHTYIVNFDYDMMVIDYLDNTY